VALYRISFHRSFPVCVMSVHELVVVGVTNYL
jgi:hypothetical protein